MKYRIINVEASSCIFDHGGGRICILYAFSEMGGDTAPIQFQHGSIAWERDERGGWGTRLNALFGVCITLDVVPLEGCDRFGRVLLFL